MDGLFDGFGEETISDDDDIRNYDDVGKHSNESDRYSGIIFYQYLDASDDKNYRMKSEEQRTFSKCNIVQLILAEYHTFRKCITSLLIKCIFSLQIFTWNEVINFAAHSRVMPESVVTADQSCRTEMVNSRV